MHNKKRVVIAGGGPAGLTAASEVIKNADFEASVFEKSDILGGISRTVNYKGNRIDIGGHRFFSKSDEVMSWWLNVLPMESQSHPAAKFDEVMLRRSRKSRILWMRKLFDYPLKFSADTFKKLGLTRAFLMGVSYAKAMVFQIKPENNLEEFFINRFGRRLYLRFFKDYTEKVWGVPCNKISADWGAQRVKGFSITKAVLHAVRKMFDRKPKDISQKDVETSLIEEFMYPKFGPGLLWETVGKSVLARGGKIEMQSEVVKINCEAGRVKSLTVKDQDGALKDVECDYFVSSMPIVELVAKLDGIEVPQNVKQICDGLLYRDFITVGLLCSDMNLKSDIDPKKIVEDNWIYIQESDVKVGRLQIFNNWSPYMVADSKLVWMGLEYFCNEGDEIWSMTDDALKVLAEKEMLSCGVIGQNSVKDSVVIRIQKAYPAYFGRYKEFPEVRAFLDKIENLFCVGRNGQHRYNNMDHSMLSAIEAVKNMHSGSTSKDNVWSVNTQEEYHESKK